MIDVQKEFQQHNSRLLYIDHKYIGQDKIGVSFITVCDGRIFGGVRLYKIVKGQIDWEHPITTYNSWANIDQKVR